MSVISGVISRQVLPVCGSLCFLCPGMRARSRQPVKRYRKLISDIFPKTPVSDTPPYPKFNSEKSAYGFLIGMYIARMKRLMIGKSENYVNMLPKILCEFLG